MTGPIEEPLTTTAPTEVAGIKTLLASAALSGALVGGLIQILSWIFVDSPTSAMVVRSGSDRSLSVVDIPLFEYCTLLVGRVAQAVLAGSWLGLVGGLVTKFFPGRYWKSGRTVKKAVFLWGTLGITLSGGVFFTLCLIDVAEGSLSKASGHMADYLRMAATCMATFTVFGLFLGLFVHMLPRLRGAGAHVSNPTRPVFPAWLRLAIYLPSAVMLYVVGIGLSFALFVAFVAPSSPFAPVEPLPQAVYTVGQFVFFLPLVLFTIWFARQYDRRSWREIGLAVTPGTPRDVLLGAALGATIIALPIIYISLGLASFPRTGNSVWNVILSSLPYFLVGAFTEELIFRSYLLPNLAQVMGSTASIWVSAFLFWAWHLTTARAAEPLNAVCLVLYGVIFGLCYLATGSLWLPVTFHASFNFWLNAVCSGPADYHLPSVFSFERHAPLGLVGDIGKTGLLTIIYLLLLLGGTFRWLYRPYSRKADTNP
jgi:CAAX protease family protein